MLKLIVNKIKNFIKSKSEPIEIITEIKNYEDVNNFIKNYKHYFIKNDDSVDSFTFLFCSSNQKLHTIIRFSEENWIVDGKGTEHIRVFIWKHKDDINNQFLTDILAKQNYEKLTNFEEKIKENDILRHNY
ncbi:MAG: hypothetical protein ACYDDE_03905 [bacterium]